MQTFRWLIISFISALAIAVGIVYWPHDVLKTQNDILNDDDIVEARSLLSEGQPQEALKIIKHHKEAIEMGSSSGKEWLDLLIGVNEKLANSEQLLIIYEYSPEALENHEKSAILVADLYLRSGDLDSYSLLRSRWQGQEQLQEAWLLLDADKLLFQGQRAAALELLTSKTFEGKADSARLMRLGLMNVLVDPKASWEYFSEAIDKDPSNAELRSYRAKLLEAAATPSLAAEEYAHAVALDPNNPWLRDQFAEFYLRQKQYKEAMELWTESLPTPSLDTIWLKTLFLNKVLMPIGFDWRSHTPPKGSLEPLIDYLLALKPQQFWDSDKFSKVAQEHRFLNEEQATYWLRLLSALQQGEEKEALQIIEHNPFYEISWKPQLELALMRTLSYRQNGTLQIGSLNSSKTESHLKEQHPIFQQLENFATNPSQSLPTDVHTLLKSKDAFSALFLAAGWMEASLLLPHQEVIPTSFPSWYGYELAQALNITRGNTKALEFITKQKSSPELELLTAELLIANNSPTAALEHLKSIAQEKTPVSERAIFLSNLLAARQALQEGREGAAEELYSLVAASSEEARSFLAKRAYAARNWSRARSLTQELLFSHPDDKVLQENLHKIDLAESGGAGK